MASVSNVNLRDRTAEYFSTFEVLRSQMLQAEQEAAETAAALRKTTGTTTGSTGAHQRKASASVGLDTVPLLSKGGRAGATGPDGLLPAKSRFTEAASQISKRIGDVAGKLEKLTGLARQRSNFDDPVIEIGKLAGEIKSEVTSLEADIDSLDRYAKDSRSGGTGQSSQSDHAIVVSLKAKLATNVSSLGNVLNLRTKNLKDQTARKKQFDSSSPAPKFPKKKVDPFQALIAANSKANGGGIAMDIDGETKSSSSNGGGGGGGGASLALNADGALSFDAEFSTDQQTGEMKFGGEQQQMTVAVQEDAYLQSRVEAVQQIETILVEVAALYRRLIEIIGQQDEMIIRIDEDTKSALDNMGKAQDELQTYLESLQANKWLLIKIFAVLIIFVIFFVGFVA